MISHQRLLKLINQLLLLLLVVLIVRRILVIVFSASAVDVMIWIDQAETMLRGQNPYSEHKTGYYPQPDVLLGFPGLIVPFLPFALLGFELGTNVYLVLGAAAMIAMYFMFAHRFIKDYTVNPLNPSKKTWAALLTFGLFTRTKVVAVGIAQSGISISFCLTAMLICQKPWLRGIFLGLATVLKYSMTPVIGIAMLIKKQYVTCAVAAVFFLLCAISPILLGYSLKPLYTEYLLSFHRIVTTSNWDKYDGPNSYGLTNIDFLTNWWANLFAKCLVVIVLGVTFIRERKTTLVTTTWLLVLTVGQMLIVYHRYYDLVFPLMILTMLIYQFFLGRKWLQLLISCLFILYYTVNFEWILSFSSALGGLIGRESVIIVSDMKVHDPIFPHVFPTDAVVSLALFIYSLYLYWCHHDPFSIDLAASAVSTNNNNKKSRNPLSP